MISDGYQHRINSAWIGCVVKGGVHFFSVYLKDGEGMSDTNAAILTQLAMAVASVRGPWIAGGDWNMTPATLAASNWPTIARGRIHAPALPTCNDKTYDYFVTSADISDAVSGVVRINDGGCSPHWTSRLYIHGGARAKAVRRLVKPLAVPGTLPMGPLNKQHYDDSHGNRANFRDWYAKARDIWGSLLCTDPGADTHQFRWEAATGKTACREAGASATSALLRAMTRKVEEATTLVQKGAEVDSPRVRNGLVHNVKACDKKQM
jgi:hypothetical protein